MFPHDTASQDQFYLSAAASTSESIVASIGNVSAVDLANQLVDDVEHNRIYAWMANHDYQALEERFGAAGCMGQ